MSPINFTYWGSTQDFVSGLRKEEKKKRKKENNSSHLLSLPGLFMSLNFRMRAAEEACGVFSGAFREEKFIL